MKKRIHDWLTGALTELLKQARNPIKIDIIRYAKEVFKRGRAARLPLTTIDCCC